MHDKYRKSTRLYLRFIHADSRTRLFLLLAVVSIVWLTGTALVHPSAGFEGRKRAQLLAHYIQPIPQRIPHWVEAGDMAIPWSFSRKLRAGSVHGHDHETIHKIAQAADLSRIPGYASENEQRELKLASTTGRQAPVIPMTVVIHTSEVGSLQEQLEAIGQQSIIPTDVWVVAPPALSKPVGSMVQSCSLAQSTRTRKAVRIRMVILDESLHGTGWIRIAENAETEWIWLLEEGAVPGLRYAEMILRLGLSNEYKSALLGGVGAIFPARDSLTLETKEILCLGMERGGHGQVSLSRPADTLFHSWIMRKKWLTSVWQEVRQNHRASPLGFLISQALAEHADIPTILIPTDPTDTTLWADTRSGNVLENACRQLRSQVASNEAFQRLIRYGPPLVSDSAFSPVDAPNRHVVFFIDGVAQAKAIQPLLCRFSMDPRYTVYALVTGQSRGVGGAQLDRSLSDLGSHLCDPSIKIQDIDISFGNKDGLPEDDVAGVTVQVARSATRFFHTLRPQLVIYTRQERNPAVTGLEMATAGLDGTVAIGMPRTDLSHVLWMAELGVETLRRWNDFTIQLIAITDRRPHSLSRLLRSLSSSHYLGDRVPLSINMEQSADRVTRLFVSSFTWTAGPKTIRHRIKKGGLMPAVVEAWYPTSNHDYAVFLEDDVEVSPLFYSWLKYTVLKYRYGTEREAAKKLFGVSLYSPRNTELEGRKPFNPNKVLGPAAYHPRTPYLYQLPCSWGAVYFPEIWREYHDYLTARLLDVEKNNWQNITIPNSRSNRWSNSWKRYFIELIYFRAYVMLYPNYADFTSFSTNHLEFGTHVKKERKAIDQFNVPLMKKDSIVSELPSQQLPTFEDLPTLDLWAKLATFDVLTDRGHELHRNVSACPIRVDDGSYDPRDLLCPFEKPKKYGHGVHNGTFVNGTWVEGRWVNATLVNGRFAKGFFVAGQNDSLILPAVDLFPIPTELPIPTPAIQTLIITVDMDGVPIRTVPPPMMTAEPQPILPGMGAFIDYRKEEPMMHDHAPIDVAADDEVRRVVEEEDPETKDMEADLQQLEILADRAELVMDPASVIGILPDPEAIMRIANRGDFDNDLESEEELLFEEVKLVDQLEDALEGDLIFGETQDGEEAQEEDAFLDDENLDAGDFLQGDGFVPENLPQHAPPQLADPVFHLAQERDLQDGFA